MRRRAQHDALDFLKPYWRPRPRETVTQWATRAIDFSREPSYPTPIRGPFDPAYMPYWREVADAISDSRIREIAVLKAARTGGTECVLLNALRWAVATRPQPILYVVSDQLSAERFFKSRIVRGLKLSSETNAALSHATSITQYDIELPACDLRITWPRARQAFKQDGWALVLCDEVSTWPDYSPDMARRRTDTYPFPHIVFLSTPDPAQKRASSDDPIFIEYERGDKRKWMMPDPAGGEFCFEMGAHGAFGLQWDHAAKREDGSWDLDVVRATAHFKTPRGTIITNDERLEYVRRGRWVATAKSPDYIRSYHVPIFLSPFRSGDFGEIAVAFLRAKEQGTQALRTFVYEWLAEPWYESRSESTPEQMTDRMMAYDRGELPSKKLNWQVDRIVIVTVDVQRDCFWALAREWTENGDSGLVDYARLTTWNEVEEFANKYEAERVGVDSAYTERTNEVYEYCSRFVALPLRGSDTAKTLLYQRVFDPYEGTRAGAKERIVEIIYNADSFRSLRLDLQRSRVPLRWVLPRNITHEYVQQVTAEVKQDGVWKLKRGQKANHLGDCETMQIVIAHMLGLLRRIVPDEKIFQEPLTKLDEDALMAP